MRGLHHVLYWMFQDKQPKHSQDAEHLKKKTSIDGIYNIEFTVEDLYENESSEHSVLLCFTPPWLAFAIFLLRLPLCCRPVKIGRPGQNPKSFLLLFGTSQLATKTNMDRTTRKAMERKQKLVAPTL